MRTVFRPTVKTTRENRPESTPLRMVFHVD